jgi:hypothetical protein
MLRLSYLPVTWKFAQIIMLPKPGKPANEASLYRPINLLPIPSKIFEKLLLNRIRWAWQLRMEHSSSKMDNAFYLGSHALYTTKVFSIFFSIVPSGGGLEYFHHSPVSHKWQQKGNPVSNETVKYGLKFCGTWT